MNDQRIPTPAEMAYARQVVDRQRQQALETLETLVTGAHLEQVATLVCGYIDDEDAPSSGHVAWQILDYLARSIVAPLLPWGES